MNIDDEISPMPRIKLDERLKKYHEIFYLLYTAIEKSNYKLLYNVMAAPNMDVNNYGPFNITPLFLAYYLKDLKVFEIFLKMGANPHCTVHRELTDAYPFAPTLLRFMVYDKVKNGIDNIAFVKLLLEFGAREVVVIYENLLSNKLYGSSLHLTAKAGDGELVNLLMNYGFNPHKENYIESLQAKDPDIVTALNKHGINPPAFYHLKAPIFWARKKNWDNCAKDMEKNFEAHIAYTNLRSAKVINDRDYDRVFFKMRKTFGISIQAISWIRFFAAYKPATLGKANDGGVFEAAKKNDLESLEAALEQGAVLNDNNVSGIECTSPLLEAVEHGNVEMVVRFIELRSSLVAINDQGTIYQCAIKNGFAKIATILLQAKQKQLKTLKSELNLNDKDPQKATLEMPKSKEKTNSNNNFLIM